MRNYETLGRENKANQLVRAMRETQPQFKDFKEVYDRRILRFDEQQLLAKEARDAANDADMDEGAGANDDYAPFSEALMAYAFGAGQLLPGAFAFLAHNFDDKKNSTDMAIGMKDGDERIVFSVDVATGTNPESIIKKFKSSARPHLHQRQEPEQFKQVPEWCASVKYCKDGNAVWGEPAAPHFIMGVMPSNVDKAIDKIEFEDGIIVAHSSLAEQDPDLKFMLVSEMFEQTQMQLYAGRLLKRDPVREQNKPKLQKLNAILINQLGQLCGTDENGVNVKRYAALKEKCKSDLVYRNIMNTTDQYVKFLAGQEKKLRQRMAQKAMK